MKVRISAYLLTLSVFIALVFFVMSIIIPYWGNCRDQGLLGGRASGNLLANDRLKLVQSDPSKAGENDLSSRLENSALDTIVPSFEASIKVAWDLDALMNVVSRKSIQFGLVSYLRIYLVWIVC